MVTKQVPGVTGGNQPSGTAKLQHLVEQDAGLADHHAALGVEGEDALEPARRDQPAAIVQAGIAIGAAIAVSQHPRLLRGGGGEPVGRFEQLRAMRAQPAPGAKIGRPAFHGRTEAATMMTTTTARISWLRQSRIMNTSGSSGIWPRRAMNQIRAIW